MISFFKELLNGKKTRSFKAPISFSIMLILCQYKHDYLRRTLLFPKDRNVSGWECESTEVEMFLLP
jgi:hypothetical protein